MSQVRIDFPNEVAAEHFVSWLSGSGEQDYWAWMTCRKDEKDDETPITAKDFSYSFTATKDGNFHIGTECE